MRTLFCVLSILSLICVCYTPNAYADEVGDAMDTREKMAKEAQASIQARFEKIGTSSASTVCPDVGNYAFPDMCQPGEEYQGNYKTQEYNGEEYYTVDHAYEDTRPRDGKNTIKNLKHNEKFDIQTSDDLAYKIQPKTPQSNAVNNEICAASAAGDTFRLSAQGESKYGKLAESTSWQYFGGQESGLFAQYPANIKTQCWCDYYDPRYRPWYSAAVTGPKDIILVLDKSGSMKEEVQVKVMNEAGEEVERTVSRFDIMVDAAVDLLGTITFLDFVQVVFYSSGAESYGTQLVRGTSVNKEKLKDYIRSKQPGGSTCGKCGIEKAFSIFKDSTNSQANNQNTAGCERIISFLTDGVMNDKDWVGSWMEGQRAALPGNNPHIFTYALGKGADTEIPSRLACENQGWMTKVEDGDPGALKHAMVRYFEYFANKIPDNNASSIPRWTEFYQDSSGQGKMTTVALPVFSSLSGRRLFVGVVGIDVLAKDFGGSLDDSALAVKLQQRSSQCVNYNFSLPEDANQVKASSSGSLCHLNIVEPSAPFIATGATIDQVPEDFCSRIPGWAVAVIILASLCGCGMLGGFVFCFCRKRKKQVQPQVRPGQNRVIVMQQHPQQHTAMQQHGQGQFYANQAQMNAQQAHMNAQRAQMNAQQGQGQFYANQAQLNAQQGQGQFYANQHRMSIVQQPGQGQLYGNQMMAQPAQPQFVGQNQQHVIVTQPQVIQPMQQQQTVPLVQATPVTNVRRI